MMYICAWQAAPLQPVGVDGLEDVGGGAEAEPGAAVFLGDEHAEVAGLGERADELGGIGALGVEAAPILAGKLGAQAGDGVADLGIGRQPRRGMVHRSFLGRVAASGAA